MISAFGYRSGLPVSLGNVLSLTLVGSLESPAVSARIILAQEQEPSLPERLDISREDTLLFSGAVDAFHYTTSSSGRLLTIEARSPGALLLDNEAKPTTLWGATLGTIFSRYCAPYGFSLLQGTQSHSLPLFSIYKGSSCWEVLCRFSALLSDEVPFVRGTQVFLGSTPVEKPLMFSTDGTQGIPYTALRHTQTPYNILSDITLRGEDGSYRTRIVNPTAVSAGIRRSRYHIPASEWQDNPVRNAHQRLGESLSRSEEWVLTLPGILPVSVGQPATLLDGGASLSRLVIQRWEQQVSSAGLFTVVTLRRPADTFGKELSQ